MKNFQDYFNLLLMTKRGMWNAECKKQNVECGMLNVGADLVSARVWRAIDDLPCGRLRIGGFAGGEWNARDG